MTVAYEEREGDERGKQGEPEEGAAHRPSLRGWTRSVKTSAADTHRNAPQWENSAE
jgi:hypothetical protein